MSALHDKAYHRIRTGDEQPVERPLSGEMVLAARCPATSVLVSVVSTILLLFVLASTNPAYYRHPGYLFACRSSSHGRPSLVGQVSVVIMNWSRPMQAQQIVTEMATFAAVGEVLVWHFRNDTAFHMEHPKVRSIFDPAANKIWGLGTRFKACQLAANPWVVLVDDDILVNETYFNSWLEEKARFPDRLYSLYSRTWEDGHPNYTASGPSADTTRGATVKIALTNMVLTDQRFCDAFFQLKPLVEDYIKKNSQPYWNGEDIYHSLAAYKVSGNWHMSMLPDNKTGNYEQINSDEGNDVGISVRLVKDGNNFNHYWFRNQFLLYAIKRLQIAA